MSAASPSLEDVFAQCCDMDASLAERLATFAQAVRTLRPAFGDAVERLVGRLRERSLSIAAAGSARASSIRIIASNPIPRIFQLFH